jgi:hypothetical protein
LSNLLRCEIGLAHGDALSDRWRKDFVAPQMEGTAAGMERP